MLAIPSRSCWRITLGALILASAIYGQTDSISALIDKARALEGRGRVDLAAQAWQQVLMVNPNQPEALAGLAGNARQQGDVAGAQRYLDRLKQVDPAGAAVSKVESTGRVAQYKPRIEEAARLAANNQTQEAMVIYREVFGDEPPPGNWAIAYYETEAATPTGWDHAIRGLQKLAARYPAAEEYQVSLGRLMTYRPDLRQQGIRVLEAIPSTSAVATRAKEAWRQALVWEGTKPTNRAPIAAYLARYPDAELQKLAPKIPAAESAPTGLVRSKEEQAAFDALNAKDLPTAESRFKEILEGSPRSVGALAGMGYLRMQQKDFGAARDYFEAARAGMPENSDLKSALENASFWDRMDQGNKASQQGLATEAETHFRAALAMRPASTEALASLAGTLLQAHKAAEAVPMYEKLVAADAKQADNWKLLFFARKESAGSKPAIEASTKFPPVVQVSLGKDMEYLTVLAAAYEQIGNTEEAARVMAQTMELVSEQKSALPVTTMLQFGGLQLKLKHPTQAAELYKAVAQSDPARIEAWEGWLACLVQQGKEKEAYQVMESMPKPVFTGALDRIGFLRLAAAVETRSGRLSSAEELIRRVLDMEGTMPQFATQVQLAGIWLEQGYPAKAERMLLQLSEAYPNEPDVWKMLLNSVSRSKKYDQAVAFVNRIPAPVMLRLQEDPGFVSVLAGVRSSAGEHREALEMLQGLVNRLQEDGQAIPADLRLQYSWLLFNARGDDNELYNMLLGLGNEKNLDAQQSKEYRELWSVWTRRRADDARQDGDLKRAVAILDAAARLMPKDIQLTSALAGTYFQGGDTPRAFQIYSAWGLKGGEAGDYASAVAAALVQKDTVAWRWAAEGLRLYPHDPDLLNIAGKISAREGDFRQAEKFWRQALVAIQARDRLRLQAQASTDPVPALKPEGQAGVPGAKSEDADPTSNLRKLLLGASAVEPAPRPKPQPASLAPGLFSRDVFRQKQTAEEDLSADSGLAKATVAVAVAYKKAREKVTTEAADDNTSLSGLRPLPAASRGSALAETFATPSPAATLDSLAPSAGAKSKQQQEIENQITAVEGQNTPYVGAIVKVDARSGRQGFEQRTLQETELETSTVMNNTLRATLVVQPTTLTVGATDTSTDLRLGLAPKGTSFPAATIAGLGFEAQLSTDAFGMSIGATPRGFPVENFTGGVRFTPNNGPVTIQASREPIKDSRLSYAGLPDSVTGRIFGGAMADSGSVRGNWGDQHSGFYVSGGYQRITGTSIESNRRFDGGVGGYWQILSLPSGTLESGVGAFTMDYAKNSRFFTLGHGGYYSPQRYFLASVPITWKNTGTRLQYVISGSIGAQYFREDAAPYFPLDQVLQSTSRLYYAAQTVTGLNFNLDLQMMYKITPNWGLSIFANANNTRNYTAQSLGFGLVRTLRPTPLVPTQVVPSIPDWKGSQPLYH